MVPLIVAIDYHSPLQTFARFAQAAGAVLFDSADHAVNPGKAFNRYSYIALEPFQTLRSKNGKLEIQGQYLERDPFTELQAQLKKYPLTPHADAPPFQGGVAGYFGYELYQHCEQLDLPLHDVMQFDDMVLGFYDLVIAYDHHRERAWVFSSGYPLEDEDARDVHARERCNWLVNELQNIQPLPALPRLKNPPTITANFSAAVFQAAVSHVIHYILEGDIFEANIAQCFSAPLPAELAPFELYRRLRAINPAPFAAYLNFNDVVIASASPERFLQLKNSAVEARPIKGTAARGITAEQDADLATQLQMSEKDRAENIMIVDLLRNDLSRVCADHSVHVTALCELESYATVHHLVSVINAQLQPDKTAIDLLRATFPGGSITGAPKIRAMQIISEIEQAPRGPYCGSVGYIGFDGNMDSSIIIRSYAIKNNRVTFQAGGAVVMDSDPVAEYQEVLTKSNALRRALTDDVMEHNTVTHGFIN